jgi:LEA14-like dessication related protein
MLRALAILACAVLLAGCSAYRAPTLNVRKAAITNVTEEGVVIRFTLDAENTNGVELPLKKITYRLYLDGREVFKGIRSPEATLRRLGSQSITLPAVVTVDEQINKLQGHVRYRIEGTLSYITPGSVAQILFDAGVRRPTVGFSDRGTLVLGVEPSEQLDAGAIGVSDEDVDSP